MELGYSISSAQSRDLSPGEAAGRLLGRVETARDAGFDFAQAGDHHVMRDAHYLQNVPTAARLTGVFDRVAALFLLPLYDPVLLAEQAGTVAAFADEFELWCTLGYRDATFEAFDVPKAERVPRFEEGLALLEELWKRDGVTFDGEFYAVEDASVNPKATPRRVCIGGSAEPAVRRAGRLGDAWVAGPGESAADLERKVGWFQEAGGGEVLVRRDALVLEDGERARRLADDLLADGYRGWGEDAWVLAGDADAVAADLDRLGDLGADGVVVRPMTDTHAPETLVETGRARRRL